jgi:hypothetical protein
MRIYYLLSVLIFTIAQLSAQVLSSGSIAPKKFSYLVGLGVSTQFTSDLSPFFRAEVAYQLSPKLELYISTSYTNKSAGDTLSVSFASYSNDGQIVASTFYESNLISFNLIDIGIGLRYSPLDRLAFRIAPGLSQIKKVEEHVEYLYTSVNDGGGVYFTGTYPISEINYIEKNLLGADLGIDFLLTECLSLNYCAYLRITDLTDDEIYGNRKDRLMQSTLSLNYILNRKK